MNRNEQQMYSDITSIRESLEKIANALNNNATQTTKDIPGFEGVLNDLDNLYQPNDPYNSDYVSTRKAILEQQEEDDDNGLNEARKFANLIAKDEEYDDDVHNDYLNDLVQGMNQIEYLQFHSSMSFSFASNDAMEMSNAIYELEYEECLGAIKTALFITGDNDYVSAVECSGFNKERKDELAREYVIDLIKEENTTQPTSDNPDPANYGHQYDGYTYDNKLVEHLDGVINDSDHDIRLTAKFYEDEYLKKEGATKKECILDYVTNEFGSHGARYSDITKFAYYLGAHNTPVKHNATRDRGYYSLALSHSSYKTGHLVTGGTNQLVKGVNKEGDERYFALSEVESFTGYWKYLDK